MEPVEVGQIHHEIWCIHIGKHGWQLQHQRVTLFNNLGIVTLKVNVGIHIVPTAAMLVVGPMQTVTDKATTREECRVPVQRILKRIAGIVVYYPLGTFLETRRNAAKEGIRGLRLRHHFKSKANTCSWKNTMANVSEKQKLTWIYMKFKL